MLRTFIFDLDDTVIDSSHRQRVLPNGDIDLAHWRRFNTAKNILADGLLPLAEQMRHAIRDGLDVAIMTSRVMGHADRVFLNIHGLLAPSIYSRDPSDLRGAGELKLAKMHEMAIDRGWSFSDLRDRVIMWDDSPDVQKTLKNAGFRVIDPVNFNNQAIKEAI